MRRTLKVALPILAVAVATWIVLIVWYAKTTVSAEHRKNSSGEASWGYELDQYRFRNRGLLTIWNRMERYETNLYYEMPSFFDPPQVIESRWLSSDTALYLVFSINLADSQRFQSTVKMIYDFETGNLYLPQGAQMWSGIIPGPTVRSNPMTEIEFQAKLDYLAKRP